MIDFMPPYLRLNDSGEQAKARIRATMGPLIHHERFDYVRRIAWVFCDADDRVLAHGAS